MPPTHLVANVWLGLKTFFQWLTIIIIVISSSSSGNLFFIDLTITFTK